MLFRSEVTIVELISKPRTWNHNCAMTEMLSAGYRLIVRYLSIQHLIRSFGILMMRRKGNRRTTKCPQDLVELSATDRSFCPPGVGRLC